ncbi:glycosyltransferase family 2 protein [Urechidicola croceus]|uniref:Glycosyltransferase 2-like domain-containing protein n=1 Tax=Urechidicola croceus TaxID=1850246 RepID=A0A1D8P4N1_9FLAO|nr:glycosyltransferase family 2 protein [Urechidicola croceus]AOW19507.1 hypothetical protein LPB138_01895 [Urechidicola croceus]
MNEPLVSIIIPTYNRAYLIAETIESILKQTFTNWECIIVDDGSSDNTEQLMNEFSKKDSRIQFYKRPVNKIKGANSCRNYGFELSKGKYINWFDSDDLMAYDFLETGISTLKNSINDFIIFDYEIFKENISNTIKIQKNQTKNLIEDYATWKINFGTWAIIWKRSIVKNYNFDESLTRAQDLDFNLRIFFNEKFTFVNSNKIGVFLRQHDKNLTSKFNNKNFESLKSEIKVRSYLINNLIKLNTDKKVITNSIKILNISFIKLYRSNEYKTFITEIKKCINFKEKPLKKIFWYSKTRLLLFIYKVFKRGDLKLKKHLLSLPFGNIYRMNG